ncbi:MAG: Ig-like domain-containing protein, partial [Kiritimatiellae bacterium]|nr:Ig-like domain-containing protein [Kiritimatiellia bacterium]
MNTKTRLGKLVWRITTLAMLVGALAPARAAMTAQYKYAADWIDLTNGQAVASWTDMSGQNRNATQGTGSLQPVLTEDGLNGLPVVHFTAVKSSSVNYLKIPDVNLAQPFTIVVVGRMLGNHASNATDIFFDGPSSGANRTIMGHNYNGSNESQFYIHQDTAALVATVTRSVWTDYHIWEAFYNGSSSALYCDGSNVISGTVGSGNLRGLLMGCYFGGYNNGLNGDIAEFHCYSGAPTSTERNALGAGLAAKYGLTSLYTPGANQAPSVTLLSPTNGTPLANRDPITLTALASDQDGLITNVAFYANGTSLGVDTSWPYAFEWSSPSSGTQALTVCAWDNNGVVATSGVATIVVPAPMAPQFVYQADALAYTNDAAVTNWTDVSGHGRHATQGSASLQPAFQTGALNGKPAVHFTAVQFSSLNYLNIPDVSLDQPFTIV